jgi:glucosamine kinase
MEQIDFIVVESGGSKSSWWFGNNQIGVTHKFNSPGLHPASLSSEKFKLLSSKLSGLNFDKNTPCYFYGAGCESSVLKTKLSNFLIEVGLENVNFQTDLLGTCIALFGENPGYAGIIGTGAIVAEYDGEKVVRYTSGLGYILGDEGSGFDIGKRVINAYFQNQLPVEITSVVEDHFGGRDQIIPITYGEEGRKIIAALTEKIYPHKKSPSISSIISEAFEAFYKTAIAPHKKLTKIALIGSVAFYYQDELKEVLSRHKVELTKVEQEAVRGLFHHHFSKSKDH